MFHLPASLSICSLWHDRCDNGAFEFVFLQLKAKYRAQVDHLRGQLAVAEDANVKLGGQVASLTEELQRLRETASCPGAAGVGNGVPLVIKQERRDSSESDTTLDGSSEGRAAQTELNGGAPSSPARPAGVTP